METGRQKSAGFGIVRVNKQEGTFALEAWPVGADVAAGRGGAMFPGWPITVSVSDCAGTANPTLPTVMLRRWRRDGWPVVQVCDAAGQIVSMTRMTSARLRPRVFDANAGYTVKILWPEAPTEAERVIMTFEDVRPGQSERLVVRPRR
jgi:hypothetical protein